MAKQQETKSCNKLSDLRVDASHKWRHPKTVLGLVLFIIYIKDTDLGLNNFISKFADKKIGNAVLSEGDRGSPQEDLLKTSDWSAKWEMAFNINECQILQAGCI